MRTYKVISIVCAAIALFFACTPINNAGTVTQTGNPTVAGILYAPGGKAPAVHATVHIRKKSALADTVGSGLGKTLTDTATVITNDSGIFHIDSLDTGTYVIEGKNGNNLVLIDSVPVKSKDSTLTLPPDTLKPAGAIKGVIRLSEGGDTRKVFILAFGIDRFARVNADGSFKFSTLAEGKYDLRLISSLDDYGVWDTLNISVKSGDTVYMDTIILPFTGIPTPKNVSIAYDTLRQIVTLSWDKPTMGTKVQGYNVYRKSSDSTDFAEIKGGVVDTVYQDSTGVQDQTYEYRVVVMDTNLTEGIKSEVDSVRVLPGFLIKDTLFKIGGYGWIYAVEKDAYGNYVVVNGTAYSPTPAKIERYSSSGIQINSWDIPEGVEEIYTYNCIAVGDSNTIFVITKYNKVIRYDTAGTILSQFQYPGTASGIGILRDTIYIGDRTAHIVQAYSSKGDSLFSWGSQGGGAGQFGSIGVLMTDSTTGNIFIEDGQGNYNRLQIFDRNGSYKSSFSFQGSGIGLDGGELDERNDTILVCNSFRIGAFTINGSFVFRYGAFNPNAVFRKAIFDNLTNNIVLFNWTGEVIRIFKK
jgi:hypothetical protein